MSNRPGRKIARQRACVRPHATARPPFWSVGRNRWIAAAVAVGLVVLVIVAANGAGDDADDAPFQMNGEALPVFGAGRPDAAVGRAAPIVVAADFDGNEIVLGGGGGPNDTAKVIVFAAHWCPTCRAEIPELAARLEAEPLPVGVEVVAISTFEDPVRGTHPPSEWFASVDWPATVLSDTANADIARVFGATSVPTWVVLDNRNTVITRTVGGLESAQLDALIDAAAGTLSG